MNHNRAINYSFDGISAAAIVGAFMGYLPALAGLAGLIWYGIQIYESKTVQKHIRRLRIKARAKRRVKAAIDQPSA